MAEQNGKRRRRWPWVILGLVVLAAAAGGVAWLTVGKPPEDVSNPEVEFTGAGARRPSRSPPRRRASEKPRDTRVIWPTFGQNPQRDRYLEANLRPPFSLVWKRGGSKLLEFPPVVAKQTLFYLKNNGEAYAVSARTGSVRWRKRLGSLAASSPSWSKNRVYFTTLSRRIWALDARHGRTKWAKNLKSRSESSPLAMDGRVYFGTENGTVYALRASNGRVLWTYKASGAVKGALAYSQGKLYFGDYAGQVTAIRSRDGKRVWRSGTAGRAFGRSGNFYSTPAVAFGRVYIGNTDGRVYSFAASSGKLAWAKSTGAYVYGSPAVARGARLQAGGVRGLLHGQVLRARRAQRQDALDPQRGRPHLRVGQRGGQARLLRQPRQEEHHRARRAHRPGGVEVRPRLLHPRRLRRQADLPHGLCKPVRVRASLGEEEASGASEEAEGREEARGSEEEARGRKKKS